MAVMVTRETRQLLTHASQFHEAKKPTKNDVLSTLFRLHAKILRKCVISLIDDGHFAGPRSRFRRCFRLQVAEINMKQLRYATRIFTICNRLKIMVLLEIIQCN